MAGIYQNGLWYLGFDMNPASQIFDAGANTASNSDTPYGFGYAWSVGTSNQKNFNTNLATHLQGLWIKIPTIPTAATGNLIFVWQDITAATAQLSLRVLPGGVFQFYLGNGTGTPVGSASASGSIVAAAWTFIETKVTINNTTGVVQCKIGGTNTVISNSGLDTQNSANTFTNAIILNQASIAGNTLYDDWYMLDNSAAAPFNAFLGPVQARGEAPNANSANGARNAWTPTNPTNVNFSNVANIPANAARFNADQTPGDYDMFRFPALPANTVSVFAIQEWALTLLDGAGARTVVMNCQSGGTDSASAAFTPGPSAGYTSQISIVDPNTGVAWTVTNAGNAELGVKVQT